MNCLIAIAIFLLLAYVFAQWFGLLMVQYSLTETEIRIYLFGIRIRRIAFRNITSCEIIPASRLWRPWNQLLFRAFWLHRRLFVDGLVIKSGSFRYVITPKDPQQVLSIIRSKSACTG